MPCNGYCPASGCFTALVQAEIAEVTRGDGDRRRFGLTTENQMVRDPRREVLGATCYSSDGPGRRSASDAAISRLLVATAVAQAVESFGATVSGIRFVPRRCYRSERADRSGCTNDTHQYLHHRSLSSSAERDERTHAYYVSIGR